ncbi:FliA/WhiG family RNA polymerase sigma factor [Thaumasiovibrio sp. DFM-14]|uniref:FliA/WhiG family RNA polymerase sigma factor n=1 Tax=Thaumasiovibrio sp. DFM-14 TaxID=3384792 RepID=UPI00399FAFA2
MLDAQSITHEDDYSQWQQQPTAVNEEAIIRKHLGMVKRIVNQLRPHVCGSMGLDDMEQIGLMGLLEAIRRYGDMDDNFQYFAVRRVRGAILDELRRRDWRPRQLRQKVHQLNNKTKLLAKELKRNPTEHEVAAAMDIDQEEYHRLLYAAQAEELHSLEQLFEDGQVLHSLDYEDRGVRNMIDENLLTLALQQLPKREQLILSLYYKHEMSLREIALVLKLTEARICQLHKQSLKNLQVVIKHLQ